MAASFACTNPPDEESEDNLWSCHYQRLKIQAFDKQENLAFPPVGHVPGSFAFGGRFLNRSYPNKIKAHSLENIREVFLSGYNRLTSLHNKTGGR